MSRIDTENAKTLRQAMDVAITLGDESFDNDDIVSVTVALRGLSRSFEEGKFSIEGSELEAKILVDGDAEYWTKFVSEFDEDEEVAYSAGYLDEDMSDIRTFYLEDASYDSVTSVLTLKACDQTVAKLENDYEGAYIESTYASIRGDFYDGLKDILDYVGIAYTEAGSVPSGTGSTETSIFFPKSKARDIIARASGLFRNDAQLAITYRDAGRPQLIAGDSVTLWELNENDIADYTQEHERNVKEFDVELSTYYAGDTEELVKVSGCVVDEVYSVELSDPIYSVGTCTNCTAVKTSLYTLDITCTTSGECTVNGRKIVSQTLSSDAPRVIADSSQKGITVTLEAMQMLQASQGSLVAMAIDDMLDEPTTVYSFKFRGDPRMQPSDIIRLRRSGDTMLVPSATQYPDTDVYPQRADFTDLRIESITLEHSGGGLTSTVTAKEATFYDSQGTLYPSLTLYPNTTEYPC